MNNSIRNNSKTPKIVVGVGLAAIYGTILAFNIPRGGNDNVAQNAPVAPVAQNQTELAPPPSLPPPVDAAAPAEASPSVAQEPAAPAAATPSVAKAAPKVVERPAPRSKPAEVAPTAEQPLANVAPASPAPETAAPATVEEPAPAPATADNSATDDSQSAEPQPQVAARSSDGNSETSNN
jgi:hypothetical protein